MKTPICFDQDWHVSSTFSDGTATVSETVHAAESLGLRSICVVDRAGSTAAWVRDLAEACKAADRLSTLDVRSGIEIEVLDMYGTLAVPAFASQVDYLFVAADHLPTPSGPVAPEVARDQIDAGELFAGRAVEWLVRAYANATRRDAAVVLARPFAVLPRLGIDPNAVHPAYYRWLAGAMLENEAGSEVNESWRAPSAQALDCLVTAGVPVLAASGARSPESLGEHEWCRGLMDGLSSLAHAA